MLSYTGQAGMPDLVQGGNVLRPKTSLKLSLRVPPTLDASSLDRKMKELLESDPPYGARVTFEPEKGAGGWEAPKVDAWLEKSIASASQAFFGKPATTWGEGGSIPFMGMLGQRYPEGAVPDHRRAWSPQQRPRAQRVPRHQHGKKVTACVAQVLADERNARVVCGRVAESRLRGLAVRQRQA